MTNESPLATAVQLLEYALHLYTYGEKAPGGDETWQEFGHRCEAFLRSVDNTTVESRQVGE